jgi:hypothetical protein
MSIHNMKPESRHQCLIYEGSPSEKLPMIAAILKQKLNEGYRCLYLNNASMVAGMYSTLSGMDINVADEIAKTNLELSSEPLIPDGGKFDSKLMLSKLEMAVDQSIRDGYTGLWASGDMTWEFGSGADFSELMEYEVGLEELFNRRKQLSGICQYHKDTLPQDAMRQGVLLHSSMVTSQTLSQLNPHYLKSSWPIDFNRSQQIDEMIAVLCRV